MKDIFVTILTSGFTTTVILALYRHFLSRNIESYKNSLLFDLQRKVHDFQLFTTKKHEKYAIQYSSLYKSTDDVLSVSSWYKQYPSFENYTKPELEDYLNQHNLLHADKNRIITLWESDKGKMQKELHKIIEHNKVWEADKLRIESYTQFSESLIYLSDKVANICEEIIKTQRALLIDHDYYKEETEPKDKKEIRNQIKTYQANLNNLRVELQKEMQSELSFGYYEELKKQSNK